MPAPALGRGGEINYVWPLPSNPFQPTRTPHSMPLKASALVLALLASTGVLAQSLSIDGCNIRRGTFCVNMNLSAADLAGARLSNSQFSRSDLSGANLTGANLDETTITGTRFNGARMAEASLKRVNARGAEFVETQLNGANFEAATLQNVDFSSANLE